MSTAALTELSPEQRSRLTAEQNLVRRNSLSLSANELEAAQDLLTEAHKLISSAYDRVGGPGQSRSGMSTIISIGKTRCEAVGKVVALARRSVMKVRDDLDLSR